MSMRVVPEEYLEPSGTSMMERFCKNSEWLLVVNYFRKKVNLRCLTGF